MVILMMNEDYWLINDGEVEEQWRVLMIFLF